MSATRLKEEAVYRERFCGALVDFSAGALSACSCSHAALSVNMFGLRWMWHHRCYDFTYGVHVAAYLQVCPIIGQSHFYTLNDAEGL